MSLQAFNFVLCSLYCFCSRVPSGKSSLDEISLLAFLIVLRLLSSLLQPLGNISPPGNVISQVDFFDDSSRAVAVLLSDLLPGRSILFHLCVRGHFKLRCDLFSLDELSITPLREG